MEYVQERIENMVRTHVICGASLALISGEEVQSFFYGAMGAVEPFSGQPVEQGMFYDLASLTKVVGTTSRILQLVDAGVIRTDTRVAGILKQFCDPEITIGHLLLHDSGLPAEIRDKAVWSRFNIRELLYATQPEGRPGERFLYSDVGFILLGNVIETLDRMALEESFQKYVFGPLGMKETSYICDRSSRRYLPTECTKERGCICGEVHDRKAYLMGPCGSAGLFSTLSDLSIFVKAYLNRSGRLFEPAMFERLLSKEQFGRTLGWSREYGPGTLYHTGFTGTSILMDMTKKRGMILLTNRIHPVRDNERFLAERRELNQRYLSE